VDVGLGFLDAPANDDRVMVSAVALYATMLIAGAHRGSDNLDDLDQILETVEAAIVPFDADRARAAALWQGHPSHGPAQSLRLRRL
jgi:hypothetical protein